MGAFTPFKRRANQFKYTPRYYDPAKEEREERREELFGKRRDSSEEYQPGQYIRNQRAARSARSANKGQKNSVKIWITIAAIVVITYMGSILYTKLIEVFGLTEGTTSQIMSPVNEYEEFDPTIPITIVPNDYDPSQEE